MAKTVQELMKQAVIGDNSVGKYAEIPLIAAMLAEDEVFYGAVAGIYGGGQAVLAATNRRVIFAYKRNFGGATIEEKPYARISSIQQNTGLVFGEITIEGTKIKQILKEQIPPFVRGLQTAMSGQVPAYDLRQANGKPLSNETAAAPESAPASPATDASAEPTKPKRRWGRIILILVLLLFVAATVSKCLDDVKKDKAATPAPTAAPTAAVTPTTPATPMPPSNTLTASSLNLSMEDILAGYNTVAKKLDIPVVKKRDIHEKPPSEGVVNRVVRVTLSPHTSAVFTLDLNSDHLKSVMMIAGGDGTRASSELVAFSLLAMVNAVTPDLTPDERGAVLKALNITGDNSFQGKWSDAQRRMTTSTPEGMGIWMSTDFE